MNDRFIKITIEKAENFKKQGYVDQALAMLEEVISLFPDSSELRFQRSVTLIDAARYEDARESLDDFLPDLPEHGNVLFRIGCFLAQKGLFHTANDAFSKAIISDDSNAWAYNNFGLCRIELGEHQDAYAALLKAVELKPDSAEFHNNLANLCLQLFRLDEAVRHYQQALELKPEYVDACSNLGRAYRLCGDSRGLAMVYRALELGPASRSAVDILLFSLNYYEQDPRKVFEEHKRWSAAVYSAGTVLPTGQVISRKRIRIGYVSADFKNHPVATFFEPVLRHYDRNQFDVFCYAQVVNPDATTAQLQELGGIWRSTVGLSDQELADQIRMDGIDILIDLSGFTEGHRLGTFILKPAPVQCSWLGYPNTTGLPQIDFRVTDAVADPPGMTEHLYTEKLIRLPRTFLCYVPGTDSPPIHPPDGPVTFCCFNNLSKVSETLISIWADILKTLPGSRILLKSAFLADFSVCMRVWSRFKEHGIDPDRIGVRGFTATKQEHLELYGTCHIALDTYPYHGTTTTCEALWMGVPVISLSGASHVSRVGTTILSAVGIPELIAASRTEYIDTAVALARDRHRIARYRQTLRSQMQVSALLDAVGFVSDLEAAFKDMLRSSAGHGVTYNEPQKKDGRYE